MCIRDRPCNELGKHSHIGCQVDQIFLSWLTPVYIHRIADDLEGVEAVSYTHLGHSLGAVHLYATLRPRFLNAGKVFLLVRRPLQRYGIEQSNEIGPCF